MNFQKEFLSIMEEQTEIALATSIDNVPNVRIVNFYYDPSLKSLFFTTFPDNQKIVEMNSNMNVAFTTIPKGGTSHIKAHGIAKKSQKSLDFVSKGFIERIYGYKEMLDQFKNILVLYEISITKAIVTVDFENSKEIEIL